MPDQLNSVKKAAAELRLAWQAAAGFLLSIEVCLMVLAAGATVGGVWLAFMADWRGLLAFVGVPGYLALRMVLHRRRLLAWPFM